MQGVGTPGPVSVPNVGQQGPYSAPPGPRGELRIPLANLPSLVKILVINLCALGLVLALIVPWVHLELDLEDENISASYDGKLQRMDETDDGDSAPDDMRDALASAGYYNVEEHYDRGLAIAGFILLLILLGAAVFIRMVDVLSPRVSGAASIALVSLSLIPAGMATVAGMRFVGGFGIAYDSMLQAMDVDGSVSAYGGLAIAIIGLFVLVLLIFELLRELRATSAGPAAGPWPWSGPFPQRLALAVIILAVAGLVTVPLSPWSSVDPEDEDVGEFYQDQGLIHGQAEGSGVGVEELRDMRRDIGYASACFWLALLFAIVGVMAIALRNMGAPKPVAGPIMLVGAMGFLFPLFGLLAHVGFMGHLKDLEIAMGDGDLAFTAYVTIVFAFLLLLVALINLAVVARELMGGRRTAPPPIVMAPAAPAAVPPAQVIVEEEAPPAPAPAEEAPQRATDPGLPVAVVGGRSMGESPEEGAEEEAPPEEEEDEERQGGGDADD